MAPRGTTLRFRAPFSASRRITLLFSMLLAAQSALAQDPVFITEDQARRSGPGHPWQGGPGSVNLFSLAKQTGLHLIGWRTKGGLPISFDLFHNSQARIQNPLLGKKWLHSCDTQLYVWSEGGALRAAVIWGDHTIQMFTKTQTWMPLDGYRDTLVELGNSFELVLKNQTVLHFGPLPPGPFVPRRSVIDRYRLEYVEDPSGNRIEYQYDAMSRLVRVKDSTSRALTIEFLGGRKVTSVKFTTPGGFLRTWSFSYDPTGRLKRVTFPTVTTDSGPQTYFVEYSYDANGNITAITDPRGSVWQYGYQGNRIAFEQWPGNSNAQRVLYTEQGTLRTVTDPRGNSTRYEYDGLSRLIRREDASFFDITFEYNHPAFLWSPSGITLPTGDHYQYEYDASGNLTAITDAAGETWNMTYDSHNNLTQVLEPLVTDAFGNVESARHRTDYQYDAMDRLIRVDRYRDQMSFDSSHFSYDAAGQQVSYTDPLGRIWSYQYDAYGNLTEVLTPAGRKTRWLYDDALTTHGFTVPNAWEDSNALRTDLLRDEWGRLRVVDFLNEPDRSYSYDAMSRIVRAIDAAGQINAIYDSRGWLVGISRGPWNCSFGYYANGLLSSQSDSSPMGTHTILYNYDARNLLTSMNDMGMVTQYAYDANGRLIAKMLANGASATYGYTNGRLSSVMQQDHVATPIVTHTYQYQDNGLLSRIDEAGSFTRYQFDFLNRLIREERSASPAFNHTYTYDAAGNRIQHDRNGVVTTYQYDLDGLLTQAIPQGMAPEMYQYDGNGRLVQRIRNNNTEIFQFAYDTSGNVRGMTQWNGQAFLPYRGYQYDALNRRVIRDVFVGGSQTERHDYYQVPIELVSLSLVSCEPIRVDKNIQGQPSTELLTWSHGIQRSNNLTGTDYWPATDGLGNLRGYTGANGSAGNYSVVYDAFGQVVQQTGQPRVYGFGADRGLRTEGDAGLMSGTNRFYDPKIGLRIPTGPASGFVDAADYLLWMQAVAQARDDIADRGTNSTFSVSPNGISPWINAGADFMPRTPSLSDGDYNRSSFFDVFVEVDLPAIQRSSYPQNGGTFTSEFYVQPRFTFTRVEGGAATPSGMHGPDLSPSSPPGRLKKIPQLGDPIGWWPFWLPPW